MVLWIGAIGCSDLDPTEGGVEEGAETGGAPSPGARCETAPDNPLRVWCSVALEDPGPVRIELWDPDRDASLRVFLSDGPGPNHRVLGWGLRPSTAWRWRALDGGGGALAEGTVVTGPLPDEFAPFGASVGTAGQGSEVEAVMLALGCPGRTVAAVDRDGVVIWYQGLDPFDPGPGQIEAIRFTEDRTVLAEIGRQTVLEFDLGGELWTRLERGGAFEGYVHHDLFKRGGLIYAIQSTAGRVDGTEYVIDGVDVFDPAGTRIDSLSLRGLYPYGAEPYMLGGYWSGLFSGAVDFSHTNAIHVDDGGDLWLSFRHLHAFARLRGGPGTEGFGELLWTAVGDPSSPIAGLSDLSLHGEDPTFAGQHDVHPASDGTILLFDNGFQDSADRSRGVRFALDEENGTLTELDSWDLDESCPIHGSLAELPGGHVLATCATSGAIREYGPSIPDPSWSLRTTCGGLVPMQFSRAIPIDL